jgi:sporulation protein YlmC with PRC-barrel domain
MHIVSASSLTGNQVKNADDENIGTIKHIMLDVERGRIAYALLDFGGFLGIGNKLFPIPWQALELDPDNGEYFLNIDKETLENAEGFDESDWPDMTDQKWHSSMYEHYGYPPYW